MASPVDLTTRLRESLPLRRYLSRVEIINEIQRAVNESLNSGRAADALVSRVATWLPAESWAVVGRDVRDMTFVIAERGLAASVEMVARTVGNWVIEHSRVYSVASLRAAPAVVDGPDVAAIAFPLVCRGQTVAALVGMDGQAAPEAPRCSATMLRVLRNVFEPAAYALDNAFRVERAEALSVIDDLTQLYNSRFCIQALRRESKRAIRSGQPLSLLYCDLDGFKEVNDQHGHLCGNRALVEVGTILRNCSRETDIAARFGGDEFVIVLPDTGSGGALAVARRVRNTVRSHVFLEDFKINSRLTASVGVVTVSRAALSADELLQAADDAMYAVKAKGKDGVQIATVSRQAGSLLRESCSA